MTFNPIFHSCDSIEKCADLINKPHEDYPRRVPITETTMHVMIEQGMNEIQQYDVLQIHSSVMWDMKKDRGCWRTCPVWFDHSPEVPPEHFMIEDEIRRWNIFPVVYESQEQIIEWYTNFQTIHPFRDGNGRVGGIIVAVLSYMAGNLIAPRQ